MACDWLCSRFILQKAHKERKKIFQAISSHIRHALFSCFSFYFLARLLRANNNNNEPFFLFSSEMISSFCTLEGVTISSNIQGRPRRGSSNAKSGPGGLGVGKATKGCGAEVTWTATGVQGYGGDE